MFLAKAHPYLATACLVMPCYCPAVSNLHWTRPPSVPLLFVPQENLTAKLDWLMAIDQTELIPQDTALCCYPHVKLEIGNLIQITTTAPIFQQSHYFRQKYLEIASWAVSLLNNIWVRVEHSLLQQLNLPKINCSSSSLQAGCE